MRDTYDVIVVGAGLGGLAAGASLARGGKRVLVLEHHSVPGGYAHEFRRGKFRFEVALHALDGASPGRWSYDALRATGVHDRLRLRRLDPFYLYRTPGLEITAHADLFAYESELIRRFPHEATGIRALFDAALRVFQQTRRLQQDQTAERITDEQILELYPEALAAMSQTLAEFISRYVDDSALPGAFSALWGYYGLPPTQLSAATFLLPWVSYHQHGAYYLEGGSMALSRNLEAVIKENGGDIRFGITQGGRRRSKPPKAWRPLAGQSLPTAMSPAGDHAQAPAFALDVIGGKLKVALADFTGRLVVLVFNSPKTAEQANALNRRLRSRHPDHRTLPIVTVVDLRSVPRPFRGIARGSMEKSYKEAAAAVRRDFAAQGTQPPTDMTEVVCIAPDWEGKVAAACATGDLNEDAVAVLVDSDGAIVGRGRGADAVEKLLEQV